MRQTRDRSYPFKVSNRELLRVNPPFFLIFLSEHMDARNEER